MPTTRSPVSVMGRVGASQAHSLVPDQTGPIQPSLGPARAGPTSQAPTASWGSLLCLIIFKILTLQRKKLFSGVIFVFQ